jgi:hypothetical protein
MKIKLLSNGTRLFVDFGEDSTSKTAMTISQVNKNYFDVKIWEGKHKCLAQTFVSKTNLLKMATQIKAHCC